MKENPQLVSPANPVTAREAEPKVMFRSRMSLFAFLWAPVPALIIGLAVMSRAGVPAGIWIRNLAATLVGVLVVVAARGLRTSRTPRTALRPWLVAPALALLWVTLLAPGIDGVHRWLGVGPLQLHVGAVVLPSLLVLLAGLDWAHSAAVAVLTVTATLLQPDGAQAASFAAGWCVWAGMTHGRRAATVLAVVAVLAGAAWLRPDPLGSVAHVEEIVGLAFGQGPLWGVLSFCALALLPAPFLMSRKQWAGAALAVYMAVTIAAAWLGNYPVPILGYGISPILGYYLAVALLTGSDHGGRPTGLQPPTPRPHHAPPLDLQTRQTEPNRNQG